MGVLWVAFSSIDGWMINLGSYTGGRVANETFLEAIMMNLAARFEVKVGRDHVQTRNFNQIFPIPLCIPLTSTSEL